MFIRIVVLHGFSHVRTTPLSTFLLTLPSVLIFYLKQWFLPIQLSEAYDLSFRAQWDYYHIGVPLALLVTIAGGVWYFRRRLFDPTARFALAALALPLLPVLYLPVFATGELVHDRYFYLPGFGAALLVALALKPLFTGQLVWGMPRRLLVVLLGVVVPLVYGTANASSYWEDDSLLFEHVHRLAPENVTARNNYALGLARRGDRGAAISVLQQLVDDRPDYVWGSYNLGRLLYETNLIGAAEHYLQQARNLAPDNADVYLQLGLVCLRSGRLDEAELHLWRAQSLRPLSPKYHFALGVALAARGKCDLARAEFSSALSLDSEFPRAREQMNECGKQKTAVKPGNPIKNGQKVARDAVERPRLTADP
jgi:tetratricopeptide (TPR) repeat protein